MCTYSKPNVYRSMNFIIFPISYNSNSENTKINPYFVSRFMHFELGLYPGMLSFSLTNSELILRYLVLIKFMKNYYHNLT
jgi:hypothetical protein